MEEEEVCLSNTLNVLSNLSRNPEKFLEVNEKNADTLKKATKDLYDFTYKQLPVKDGLPELVIEHFDNEQIWQELELYNTGVIGELITDLSHLLAGKEKISFKTTASLASSPNDDDGLEAEEEEEGAEVEEEEESDEELKKIKSRLKAFDKIASRNNNIASDLDSDSDGDPDDLAKEFHEENDMSDGGEEKEEEGDESEGKVPSKDKKKSEKKNKAGKPTIVDDKFFKLSEMDTFLKQQDALEMKKSKGQQESDEEDEDIDVFQDIESDKEENVDKLKFKDFFRGPGDELPSKRVRFRDVEGDEDNQSHSGDDDVDPTSKKRSKLFDSDEEEEESDGEEVSDIIGGGPNDQKSTFELRQQRLQKKISQLEKASVANKSWQLGGEISAAARPENSLLEEHVQFDSTLKLAPEITEESTKTLEDLIILRIKDQAWDDVERKVKTADAAYEYKKPTTLDQEKSKLSLGEIYEKEYQKQQEETQEETPKKEDDAEHEAIRKMMNSLFMKLDALSNFHFTPKIPIPDVKIIANLPSITMEEVAPVGVSENQLAAPKELLNPLRNSLKSKTERTVSDRNKERKLKKKLKKLKSKEKEKKQKYLEMHDPGSAKTSKNKALRKLEKQSRSGKKVTVIKTTNVKKGKKSSSDFFNQLQNEVTHEVTKKKQIKKKINASGISSVQLKL